MTAHFEDLRPCKKLTGRTKEQKGFGARSLETGRRGRATTLAVPRYHQIVSQCQRIFCYHYVTYPHVNMSLH